MARSHFRGVYTPDPLAVSNIYVEKVCANIQRLVLLALAEILTDGFVAALRMTRSEAEDHGMTQERLVRTNTCVVYQQCKYCGAKMLYVDIESVDK